MRTQSHTSALDISTPDDWSQTHGLISDALTAISFAHPACAAAEIRMRLQGGALIARVENTRRSRLGSFWIELGQAGALAGVDSGAVDEAMPEAAEGQARSLRLAIASLASEAIPLLAGSPGFVLFGNNLGLGLSERWDADHADGIERAGEGLAIFEEAALGASENFPLTTLMAARAGSEFLQGEAKSCAQGILAELEAQGLQDHAPEPTPERRRVSKSI